MQPSEYRPISTTAVLSQLLERHIVKSYIYPTLHQPPPQRLCFSDQFAFRPTGSTTAALIALLHTVCSELSTNSYVQGFALDFSKAFDTVRRAMLMENMMQLLTSDQVYNWIKDFFHGHFHCTKFAGSISELADILACVIQSSAIGPAAYLVTAADLHPMHDTNKILKFADDTYVIVPATNTNTFRCPCSRSDIMPP